jgi:hypothetical protein
MIDGIITVFDVLSTIAAAVLFVVFLWGGIATYHDDTLDLAWKVVHLLIIAFAACCALAGVVANVI